MTSTTRRAPSSATPALVALIVSTQWLADHLGSDDLVILDATVLQTKQPSGTPTFVSGDEEYLVHGHIPSAVFADILGVFSDPDGRFGFTKPSAEQFEAAAASVGVDNHTTVIVYDNSVGHWAARIWWLFRAFGHDDVAVLDGGLRKWTAEDRPLDVGYVPPRSVEGFSATEHPEFWVDRARAGHIPGSVNAPAAHLVDRKTNAFLPADALRALFTSVTSAGSPIVSYCSGGIAAASDALALAVIGRTDVAIYDGSLNEWAADPGLPLVTNA